MGIFTNWWTNIAGSLEDISRAEMTRQAEQMVAEMRSKTHDVSGNLDRSIRVVQRRTKRGRPAVQIKAGGPLTTTPSGYDYARAEEFGTVKESARPFFYATVRARRAAANAAIKKAIMEALTKNRIGI